MDEPVVERWTDPAAVVEVLEPHEPSSTPIVGLALERRLDRRDLKVWRVRDGRATTAAFAARRVGFDRWLGWVVELVPGAAAALGPTITATAVRRLTGPTPAIRSVAATTARVRAQLELPAAVVPPPAEVLGEPDPRARLALVADLERVLELVGTARLDLPPTWRRLRRVLAEDIARAKVAVVEEPEVGVVGAIRLEYRTRRYAWMNGLVMDPAFRGRGLSWVLANAAMHLARAYGTGLIGVQIPANPMTATGSVRDRAIEQAAIRPDLAPTVDAWTARRGGVDPTPGNSWTTLTISRPSPLPGVPKLMRAVELAEGAINERQAPWARHLPPRPGWRPRLR